MKRVLLALVALALVGGTAYASVPDPDFCEVQPQDGMDCPKLIGVPSDPAPARFSTLADVEIWVRAFGNTPIENAYVEIVMNELCEVHMCYCQDNDMTGITDAVGYVKLNLMLGGCCTETSSAIILAGGDPTATPPIPGTPIRAYDMVTSPDFDGTTGNCAVALEDLIFFAAQYGSSTNPCTDYSGDCVADLTDLILFAAQYGQSCVPMP